MSKIKLLNDEIINQIAAGEIVERPGSALKELIENAIDAKAQNIEIFLKNGGKSKIIINDDGEGLSKEDLKMCVKRHATSKLSDINLFNIKSFGFRGEAIPSIASVSRFSIESRGFGISVNFSAESEIFPSPVEKTKISVEDLFSATPVRLKFLKSDSVELANCISIVENFALTSPSINFVLRTDEKQILSFKNDSLEERASKIFGAEDFQKAIQFEEQTDLIKVSGYLFHPTSNRYSSGFQKVFVNNRFVKDKIISSSLKNAYKNLLPPGRFALALIMLEIDPFYVDVNISPTKSEIRFRDPSTVQKFLTNCFAKHAEEFDRVSLDFDTTPFERPVQIEKPAFSENVSKNPVFDKKVLDFFQKEELSFKEEPVVGGLVFCEPPVQPEVLEHPKDHFFGKAVCQIFDSFIISEKENEIFIIDQHAVHEKITQTKLLKQINEKNKQFLVKPEIIDLSEFQKQIALKNLDCLANCGFEVELIKDSLIVSAVPAVIENAEIKNFIFDVLSEDLEESVSTLDLIKKKIADKACHNSIRFGRKLSIEEMNKILEQMEETPTIHQCNHHRPSFISLSKDKLCKMFERP